MNAPLVFLDTETTSLRHDRRAWEIGMIKREPHLNGGTWPTIEKSWFIDDADLDLGNADLQSLKIGRFHERHPQANRWRDTRWELPPGEKQVLGEVEELARGAHLVGNVVDFDADVLRRRMWANGICPSWHYHLIDIESMAVGYLKAMDAAADLSLPWESEELSHALGVEPPDDEERHTALGDAQWAMRLYDAIMGGAS